MACTVLGWKAHGFVKNCTWERALLPKTANTHRPVSHSLLACRWLERCCQRVQTTKMIHNHIASLFEGVFLLPFSAPVSARGGGSFGPCFSVNNRREKYRKHDALFRALFDEEALFVNKETPFNSTLPLGRGDQCLAASNHTAPKCYKMCNS